MCDSGNWGIKYERQRKSPDDSYVKGLDSKQDQKKFMRASREKVKLIECLIGRLKNKSMINQIVQGKEKNKGNEEK